MFAKKSKKAKPHDLCQETNKKIEKSIIYYPYNNSLCSSIYFCKFIAIAGQTAGPNWLKYFVEHFFQNSTFFQVFLKFHGQRRALQLVCNITQISLILVTP